MHIDEIEDSEDPMTPSPPRRRKRSASPPRQTLTLSQAAQDDTAKSATDPLRTATTLDSAGETTKAAAKTKDAATRQHTPEVLAALFPQITQAIKEEPRSQNHGKLSWHEHILLYDPIVLEDLQEWLHAKGLRMRVPVSVVEGQARGGKAVAKPKAKKSTKAKAKAKAKPKAKGGRGKKKKNDGDAVTDAETDSDGSAGSGADTDADSDVQDVLLGGEAAREQQQQQPGVLVALDPWVVQRWCDANSVCCTFRESRNARKTR
ncbi:uncharacterized protein K452DRAFT_285195 [Aplosporella prunicola CBS 121167]|uniref:Structure-specific endonuclease subunit SLX4 n=1 Tax=Aplosporella prunicola CBS 121167 TaxID=1176127 RepID=A0A6A6BN57_9PEZI|nr:uncharacterized protein K452DRAFT_285195 [Aplosporella prunicola CBS 121167]KAF2143991.1 hypothetical protein K452DRAFT_285195 [Aplosporella prunicola CBS 121167]